MLRSFAKGFRESFRKQGFWLTADQGKTLAQMMKGLIHSDIQLTHEELKLAHAILNRTKELS